ncbi:splicing factor U2AF 35 kDa subunit isoform X1 [Dendropsophus ebraccatus]|uniref:splicing factor U2AF 35 kDa subunit isoform X1 n=2 Tax=Dendropsophus ebraccatus TaxID=150705 RepID=UPI0038311925
MLTTPQQAHLQPDFQYAKEHCRDTITCLDVSELARPSLREGTTKPEAFSSQGNHLSKTIALLNIYRNPQNSSQSADGLRCAVSDVEMQEHYDEFFEEVFTEMEEKYGEVEEMNVCDNLGDHLVGNVYVKFRREEDAEKAVKDLNNRWFNGQPIHAELSPVTDFREACCRQYEMGECTRGGFCNFMHLKPISRELRRELYGRRRKKHRSRSRSRERRSRSRDRGRGGGGGGGGGGRDRDRRRSRDRERSGRF